MPSSVGDDLLRRLRAGDLAARAELFARLYAPLRAYFQRAVRDRAHAEDYAAEVITRALEGIAGGGEPEALERWIWGIARHVLIEHYRGERPAEPFTEDTADQRRPGEDADHRAGKWEALNVIRIVLPRLGDVQRQVMTAYLTQSLLVAEEVKGERLAQALGRGWSAARVNRELDRARESVAHDVGVLSVARASALCPAAATLVTDDERAATAGRRAWLRLSRHAAQCPICGPVYERSRHNAAWALGPGLLLLWLSPADTSPPVRVSDVVSASPPAVRIRRRRGLAWTVSAAVAAALVTGAVLRTGTHAADPPLPTFSRPPTAAASAASPSRVTSAPASPSTAAGPVTVPDVVGDNRVTAEAILEALPLAVSVVVVHGTAPKDQVVTQNLAPGSTVAAGSPVVLSLSLGDEALVPDITGMTWDQATAALGGLGFSDIRRTDTAAPSPSLIGHVTGQSTPTGTPLQLTAPLTVTVAVAVTVTSLTVDAITTQCAASGCSTQDVIATVTLQTNVPGPVTLALHYDLADFNCTPWTLDTSTTLPRPGQYTIAANTGQPDASRIWLQVTANPAAPGQPIKASTGTCYPPG